MPALRSTFGSLKSGKLLSDNYLAMGQDDGDLADVIDLEGEEGVDPTSWAHILMSLVATLRSAGKVG